MLQAYKYRLFPSKAQARLLAATLEECRWLYNNTLAFRKHAWHEEKRHADWHETKRRIPLLKQHRPWLKDVYSQVLQNVTQRVDLAYQALFRRVRTGQTPGFPRFKARGRYDSFTYPQSGFKLEGFHVYLAKIGRVWVVLHRPLEGTIKTLTLRRSRTGKWSACFTVELADVPQSTGGQAVGIDVGIESFATLSTGQKVANPRFFRTEQKALAQVQRRLSRQEKGTQARSFRRKAVGRVHERIRWRRENFAHQESRKLVGQYGVIVFEDLNIEGMLKNHCLAKSIADAAWHQLVTFTTRKAVGAGGRVVLVNPRNTTKMCSGCGRLVEKSLSERVHSCSGCGLSLDRDSNAAINILRLGLQSLGNAQEARPVALCAQGRE